MLAVSCIAWLGLLSSQVLICNEEHRGREENELNRAEQTAIKIRLLPQLERHERKKWLALLKRGHHEKRALRGTDEAPDAEKQDASAEPARDTPEAEARTGDHRERIGRLEIRVEVVKERNESGARVHKT